MTRHVLHPHTAKLNRLQKLQSKQSRKEALTWLAERFPHAFDTRECIRPLAKGIMDDILAYAEEAAQQNISKSKLREAIVIFTRRIEYLTCLKSQEMRVNLLGDATEPVSKDEADKAALKIKRRIENTAKSAQKNTEFKPVYADRPAPPYKPASYNNKTYGNERAQPKYPRKPFNNSYPSYASQDYVTPPPPKPAPSVVVKTARTFDPAAVAKLKEKLGIKRQNASTEPQDA